MEMKDYRVLRLASGSRFFLAAANFQAASPFGAEELDSVHYATDDLRIVEL